MICNTAATEALITGRMDFRRLYGHDGRMRSRPEKTQPGNPHGLTTKQHVFPVASINRFEENGGVDLFDIVRQKRRKAPPRDPIFYANRAWSHGAEVGFMKSIEDAFQHLARQILEGGKTSFSKQETKIITEFYGLCQARADRRHLPYQHIKMNGVSGTCRPVSADEFEQLEKHNVMSIRPDGTIAMRDLLPSMILADIERISEELEGKPWGVLRSIESEFCVPDIISRGILPLTPRLVLAIAIPSDTITEDSVTRINRTICASVRHYLFARNLDVCPGTPSPAQADF